MSGRVADVANCLDFGLVPPVGGEGADAAHPGRGMLVGTPDFMSRSSVWCECVVTPASDIYSLGALGFFLLTGALPFGSRTTMQTIVAHVHEIPRSIAEVRPDVPRELSQVIARCLAKEPHDRFPDTLALKAALAQSVRSDAVHELTL